MEKLAILFAFCLFLISAFAASRPVHVRSFRKTSALNSGTSTNNDVPDHILVDIYETSAESSSAKIVEAQDFGTVLRSHKKCVLFAVPGAFTPTCSNAHLPGFVSKAREMREKGVEAIYCMSVNDKFVMKAWAEATPGCSESGIKFVADGNGAFTTALGLLKDATGSRMGLRCKRFAAIIEQGKITLMNVDEKGLDASAADNIISALTAPPASENDLVASSDSDESKDAVLSQLVDSD